MVHACAELRLRGGTPKGVFAIYDVMLLILGTEHSG